MKFELAGDIANVEVIAAGPGVRIQAHLRKLFGGRRWRKLKGTAIVRMPNGTFRKAELHWYESHGIGKKSIKIKRFLDEQ